MGDQDTISLYNIFQYNIKQTSDEHKEKYKLRNWKLIKYQILQTNITRTVWQTVWRITNEILRVTGLSSYASTGNCKKIIVQTEMSVNWNYNNFLPQNRKIKHQSANIEFCWIFQSYSKL